MAGLPHNRVVLGPLLAVAAVLSACASPPQNVAPPNLDIECQGEGSPVVILLHALSTDRSFYDDLMPVVATDTRVCAYSRAGLGKSPPWPEDLPDPTAGTAADQLLATLQAHDIPGPYVLLGWSYGGIVTQAFAARHPDEIAGVIFEDTATVAQFGREEYGPPEWSEGGRAIDLEATTNAVDDLVLTDVPLIVLTQGDPKNFLTDAELEWWTRSHDDLADRSENSLHLIAVDAEHAIHWDAQALVEKAIDTVVEAVRTGEPLGACGDTVWAPYAGECRAE
jgi:pimeloyl-ACP methyl ester carboxylesterase